MKRILISGALFALMAGFAASFAAAADKTPERLEPIPEPPDLGDSSMDPEITIRNRGQERVEEYRIHGRLYMIKVTPRIGRPYYLINRAGEGSWVRMDGLDQNFVVPQWVIKTW